MIMKANKMVLGMRNFDLRPGEYGQYADTGAAQARAQAGAPSPSYVHVPGGYQPSLVTRIVGMSPSGSDSDRWKRWGFEGEE